MIPTPKDMTLMEVMAYFSDEEKARAYLESVRWPEGPYCPHEGCGNADPKRIYPIKPNPAKKVRPGLYECGECGRQFTVTKGTIFESSKIPLQKWLIAWYLVCSSKKGVSALQIQRQLKLGSYRTAWFMLHRIREALADRVFTDKLGGTVEVDETYVGGKKKGWGVREGKMAKTPVVSIVERDGRVRSFVPDRVSSANLKLILDEHVDEGAKVMTDESRLYWWPRRGPREHASVNHRKGEYVRGKIHTNTVEGYFSIIKRGINGTFHHVDRKYMDMYLAEFDHRYNFRKVSDGERTFEGLKKVEGKRLTLKGLKG